MININETKNYRKQDIKNDKVNMQMNRVHILRKNFNLPLYPLGRLV